MTQIITMVWSLTSSGEAEVPPLPSPSTSQCGGNTSLSCSWQWDPKRLTAPAMVNTFIQPKSDCPFSWKVLPSPCCFMDSLLLHELQFIFQQEIFVKSLDTDKTPVLSMASLTLTPCPFSRLSMIVPSCVFPSYVSYMRPGPQWALNYLSILKSLNNVLIKLRSFLPTQ